jgi:hypothetical protein
VASELCTVVDDGTLHASRGSLNVDDEGNVPGSATLIERGILVGYMHDHHSATHFGKTPSGNGRRESFASRPLPRMTNTLLLGGQDDPADILRSVKRGVYARKFGGGQVDISNGDFVFSLTEGYLIEDGKLTAPLKGVKSWCIPCRAAISCGTMRTRWPSTRWSLWRATWAVGVACVRHSGHEEARGRADLRPDGRPSRDGD